MTWAELGAERERQRREPGRRMRGWRCSGGAEFPDRDVSQAQQHVIHAPNLKDPGYIRQKANNKLWVRERIAALLDQDSFAEVGSITGRPVVDDEGNLNSFVPA